MHGANMRNFSKSFEIIKHWDSLPDDAVVSAKITAIVLGIAERSVRYHRGLQRAQLEDLANECGLSSAALTRLAMSSARAKLPPPKLRGCR
jgi:hypothetical protein